MRAGSRITGWVWHDSRRQFIRWWNVPLPGAFPTAVHANCVCNEYVSLRNRVIMEVPLMTQEAYRSLLPIARSLGRWLGRHEPLDGGWYTSYSGRKRDRYVQARASLDVVSYRRQDNMVMAFVKSEKLEDGTKDPRMIQCRTPRFSYLLGNYLKPLEHKLYCVQGTRELERFLPSGRLIAKGLDSRSRATLLKAKMEEVGECVVYSMDCSRFDAHVGQLALRLEHLVYQMCYPGHKLLQQLLQGQLVNRGVTAGGLKYTCPGGRMSGDMNTALGNCIIMIIMLAGAMRRMGFKPREWQCLDDGDDCLLIVHARDEDRLENLVPIFRTYGHVLKLENRATNLHQVTFCQSRVVECADGLKFVQSPQRTLSRGMCSVSKFRGADISKFLRTLATCELSISMGVPILQEYALTMMRSAGPGPEVKPIVFGRWFKAKMEIKSHGGEGSIRPLAITPLARATFDLAFGLSPCEQEYWESWIRTHPISTRAAVDYSKSFN